MSDRGMFGWILLSVIPLISSQPVDLPGVDVLSAGYDAASWSTKGSGYAIFNLSMPGSPVFIRQVNRTFTPPAIATVITDGPNSRRVEETCESVDTDFESYLHTYEESISFDVGISTNNFSLGFAYHKEVAEVYQAITDDLQAFGTSKSWWGMFEIALPPPFLLSQYLHPLFQSAKATLAGIGEPKTEEQQAIYNQVCCGPASFGTHYIGSVILGGQASILTAVNNSFHSEYSNRTVTEQISFGFMYQKLKLSGDKKAKEFEEKMMQQFRNSSHARVEYKPDIPSNASDTPWLLWERTAASYPVVINMTVARLSGLFIDQPAVHSHMERTIGFYIENARAPTLEELQETPAPIPLIDIAEPTSEPEPVPGLHVVGCGYDVTRLSPKLCLYNMTRPGSVWSNPMYPNISYSVPLGYYVRNTPESLVLNGTIVYESIEDWTEHSWWIESHHSSGFLGFGSKSETKTTEMKYRYFYAHRYFMALSLRQIAWYTLTLSEFPQPPLDPWFVRALQALPSVYNSTDNTTVGLYSQFFDHFGTHVTVEADMGGVVWAEDWFESCLLKIYKDVCVTDEIRRRYDPIGFIHKDTDRHTCDEHIQEDYEKYSTHHFELLGGTDEMNVTEWEAWALTVKNDPKPIKLTLRPIHELLIGEHARVRQAMEEAMLAYLTEAEQQRQDTISELEKLRPPPAPVCERPPRHVETGRITQDGDIRDDPRSVLCPITGYNGAFCPNITSSSVSGEQFVASSMVTDLVQDPPLPLPRGVGLTLDTSTGELKLPAVDYTGLSGAVWVDPATNLSFAVPSGISLNDSVQAENAPQIHVFSTEDEMAAVWEQGFATGSWLGGEFGHSQSLTDLYSQFFSKEQSASVNQYPAAVYRLQLQSGWEGRLNQYAKQALTALPESGDNVTYQLFLDTWGTHVASDTLVGGLMEMQMWLKNCIWGSPFLTGGLTPEQLEHLLTLDLTKDPIQDNYYLTRRKLSIDHRLGGNPEIQDKHSWFQSISRNPALLKIFSHTPWDLVANRSGIVSDAVIGHLRAQIAHRMEARANERREERQRVEAQRRAELLGPRNVVAVVAHGRRGTIAPEIKIGSTLSMKGYADCPPGLSDAVADTKCTTGVNIESWNRYHITKPLRYERNEQGEMRSSRCFDLDNRMQCIDHFGPWVRVGCSEQPFANGTPRNFSIPVPDRTVVGAVCAVCQPMGTNFAADATIKCACPGYTELANPRMELSLDEAEMVDSLPPPGVGAYLGNSSTTPDYKQCDPQWGCEAYAGHPGLSTCNTTACNSSLSENNICVSGCGIVSSAMVISHFNLLTHQPPIWPSAVAQYLTERGYRDDLDGPSGATCNGVSHSAICSAGENWGLGVCNITETMDERVDEWLQSGPVIAHVRQRHFSPLKCKFTRGGHYIVLTGVIGTGNYSVHDPNSLSPDRYWGTVQQLAEECAFVGAISLRR